MWPMGLLFIYTSMYINTGNGIHYHIVKISLYCLKERTLAIIAFPAYKAEFTDLMCITISNYPVDVYDGHVSLNLDYFMEKERVFSMGLVSVVFNLI